MKFVVGKLYRNRFSNAIRECLFASEEISVLSRNTRTDDFIEKSKQISVYQSEKHQYEDYTPPPPKKTGEFWVNVYSFGEGVILNAPHKTREDADQCAKFCNNRIACVHSKWTEGDGLQP